MDIIKELNLGIAAQMASDGRLVAPCGLPSADCIAGCADCILTHAREAGSKPGADFRTGDQAMEAVIAKLLQDFEQGKMNRRQLIKSLSVAAAAAAGMAPAARAAGKPLEALYVNHISYQVNDYKKVRDFYVDLLGMKVTEDNGQQCRLLFGNNILIPRNRANGGPARVDHIAYTVTNWDAEKDGLEEELKRRGLEYRGSAKTSFQVKDPEGMGVQFGGLHQ
jgi:catechol 2,3-dioxygenase-like lactoylglutathione lyase family enzyme